MSPNNQSFPIDFTPIWNRESTYLQLAETVTKQQLADASTASINAMLSMLTGLSDADVVFEPDDEAAHDPYAVAGEETIGWNLAHLIAHVTASSEEGASIAARLARGIAVEGRDRYETPWRDITTVAHCRRRLAESLRMRLALLDAWPNEPHLDVYRIVSPRYEARVGRMNAPAAFLSGLSHEVGHWEQMQEVRRQALAARSPQLVRNGNQ